MRDIGIIGELTALQRDILYVVANEDGITGVEVRRKIEDLYDTDYRRATIYDAIRELRKEGLVQVTDESGRSKLVGITVRGMSAIESHHMWEWSMLHTS